VSPLIIHRIKGVPSFYQKDCDKALYESFLVKAGYTKGAVQPAKGNTWLAYWTHPTYTRAIVWYNADQTRVGSAVHDGDWDDRNKNQFLF
jgi:hypothetical protein